MEIEKLTADAVNVLKNMVNIPSISRDEKNVADYLEQYMKDSSLQPQRYGNNIWCISPYYNKGKATLLLNAHMDTVKPSESWTRHPYHATQEGESLYGLGTNDDGGSVVALLQTFITLCQKEQPYNLIYLVSCEEELSGKNGIEAVLPLLPPIDIALVGEPTDMHAAIAEKGLMVVDVTAHGKSGHAARNEGENAIYKALKDIEWFKTYHFEKSSSLLGEVKMSVTIINAGTQHNVIPDKCTFTVDIRSNEHYSNEEIYQTICAHISSEAKARSFRLNSSRISEEHPIIKKIKAMGRNTFGSPTLSDQALMPFPSFKMGPGSSSRSHTADEYITISEIKEAIQLYIEILDGLDLNHSPH